MHGDKFGQLDLSTSATRRHMTGGHSPRQKHRQNAATENPVKDLWTSRGLRHKKFHGHRQRRGKSGFRWDRNWGDVMWAPPCRWPSSFMLDQPAQHIMQYPQLEQKYKSLRNLQFNSAKVCKSPLHWSLQHLLQVAIDHCSHRLLNSWGCDWHRRWVEGEAPWHEYMEGWKVLSSSQSLAMSKKQDGLDIHVSH